MVTNYYVYDQIDMQIIWKQTFDGSKMLKGGDNQGFIYLPQY